MKLLLLHETIEPPKRVISEADALHLENALTREGHEVVRIGAPAQAAVTVETSGEIRLGNGAPFDLAGFDGASFCAAPSIAWRADCERLLSERGVFIYQDLETARAASDKLRSLAVFYANAIPTPRTLGFHFDQPLPPDDMQRFLQSIGTRPYVVKKSYGWSGLFVRFPTDADEAERLVWEWHRENIAIKRGGVLAQEFIDSGEQRKCDYRIHTVVARDGAGKLEPQIAAAFLRVAKAGKYMTHLSRGAERRRMAFDFDEGERFYVGRRGLTPQDYRAQVEAGIISLLPEPVAALALKTAAAFGLGYLGQDIIVRQSDGAPFVLEVNPTTGAKAMLETEEGFDIYRNWARAFAQTAAFAKAQRASGGSSDLARRA